MPDKCEPGLCGRKFRDPTKKNNDMQGKIEAIEISSSLKEG
jgi:hypothetical protein